MGSNPEFDVLGSGIAWRSETNEKIEGNYQVRYYIKGNETPVFNVDIKRAKDTCDYLLDWTLEDKQVYHGIGLGVKNQLAFAWGDLCVDWELVILSIENNGEKLVLRSNHISVSNNFIREEVLIQS